MAALVTLNPLLSSNLLQMNSGFAEGELALSKYIRIF